MFEESFLEEPRCEDQVDDAEGVIDYQNNSDYRVLFTHGYCNYTIVKNKINNREQNLNCTSFLCRNREIMILKITFSCSSFC